MHVFSRREIMALEPDTHQSALYLPPLAFVSCVLRTRGAHIAVGTLVCVGPKDGCQLHCDQGRRHLSSDRVCSDHADKTSRHTHVLFEKRRGRALRSHTLAVVVQLEIVNFSHIRVGGVTSRAVISATISAYSQFPTV